MPPAGRARPARKYPTFPLKGPRHDLRQNVTKAFGPKKLFEDVNVAFSPGNRYGLTGPNGAGKSTFMKILAGDEEADTGAVLRPKRLGILRQDHFRYEDKRVLDVVLMGNKALWDAHAREGDAPRQGGHHRRGRHTGSASSRATIGEEDGYTAEADAAELLVGLGIEEPCTSSRCAR